MFIEASRTRKLVLGFFAHAWVSLVIILAFAPEVYNRTLGFSGNSHHLAEIAFVAAPTIFVTLLGVGVLRRRVFWLALVAFLFGVLRVLTSALELTRIFPTSGPGWYTQYQAALGLAQFTLMPQEYRQAGVWGTSR